MGGGKQGCLLYINREYYKIMELKEFIIHKTRWLNGWGEHMKLGNIDFKTYMRMNGMSEEEFDMLNEQADKK